jgi:hypothetical protein
VRTLFALAALAAFISCSPRDPTPPPARPEMSPAMIKTIREHTRTDHQGLDVVRKPDGSMSMDLRRRFRSVPVAYVDEHGKTQVISGSVTNAQGEAAQ